MIPNITTHRSVSVGSEFEGARRGLQKDTERSGCPSVPRDFETVVRVV
jgi:hypothetical protein